MKRVLKRIALAYERGKCYAAALENRSWVGRDQIPSETDYYNWREAWQRYAEKQSKKKEKMSFIERLAFTFGDEAMFSPIPLKRPYNLPGAQLCYNQLAREPQFALVERDYSD